MKERCIRASTSTLTARSRSAGTPWTAESFPWASSNWWESSERIPWKNPLEESLGRIPWKNPLPPPKYPGRVAEDDVELEKSSDSSIKSRRFPQNLPWLSFQILKDLVNSFSINGQESKLGCSGIPPPSPHLPPHTHPSLVLWHLKDPEGLSIDSQFMLESSISYTASRSTSGCCTITEHSTADLWAAARAIRIARMARIARIWSWWKYPSYLNPSAAMATKSGSSYPTENSTIDGRSAWKRLRASTGSGPSLIVDS